MDMSEVWRMVCQAGAIWAPTWSFFSILVQALQLSSWTQALKDKRAEWEHGSQEEKTLTRAHVRHRPGLVYVFARAAN